MSEIPTRPEGILMSEMERTGNAAGVEWMRSASQKLGVVTGERYAFGHLFRCAIDATNPAEPRPVVQFMVRREGKVGYGASFTPRGSLLDLMADEKPTLSRLPTPISDISDNAPWTAEIGPDRIIVRGARPELAVVTVLGDIAGRGVTAILTVPVSVREGEDPMVVAAATDSEAPQSMISIAAAKAVLDEILTFAVGRARAQEASDQGL